MANIPRWNFLLADRYHVIVGSVVLIALVVLPAGVVQAQEAVEPLAAVNGSGSSLVLAPNAPADVWVLTVSGPGGFQWRQEFRGQAPKFSAADLTEGVYSYQLQAIRGQAGPNTQGGSFTVVGGGITSVEKPAPMRAGGADGLGNDGRDPSITPFEPVAPAAETGSGNCDEIDCTLVETGPDMDGEAGSGTPVAMGVPDVPPSDGPLFLILDDLIVDGSACIGFDCVNGESFGFDTIRIKENNLRIRAVDTSSAASFPSNDWQLTFNDSSNGGANKFSIDDIDGGRTPFTLEAGAPSHSLYVDDGGRIGNGTNTPVVDFHIKSGNTPTTRLEQDGSSGFTPQTWDVAGNEANFFIRDATNGSTLPFRIFPGAPSNALTIEASTGDIGVGTTSPTANIDVVRTAGGPEVMFRISNNNRPIFEISNSNVASSEGDWRFSSANNGDFEINNVGVTGTTAVEFDLAKNGDLTVAGDVTANGILLTGSSRASKANLALVDSSSILARVAALPLYEWNYIVDGPGVRHAGPMAEDFWQAFGYAGDDRHVAPTDMAAVALAAVQELTKIVQSQQQMLTGYRATIMDLGGDPDAAVAAAGGGGSPVIGAAGMIAPGSIDDDPNVTTAEAPEGFTPIKSTNSAGVDSPLLRSLQRAMAASSGTFEDPRGVVRVYKNYDAWWGEDQDSTTLSDMGKSRGYDWFVHDVSETWSGIPEDTNVAIMTSASSGDHLGQITHQNGPSGQASLKAFVQGGGTLLLGLADNDENYGYIAPGAIGTPSLVMPSDCGGATLANSLYGADRLAGTDDDHPLLKGPDGAPATADDLTPFDVGLHGGCYVAHGNLVDGLALPEGAQVLMSANFGGLQKPVLAEYALGDGRVIVTTLTMEYLERTANSSGASKFLTNLFSYALDGVDESDEELDLDGIGGKGPGR